MFGAVPVATHRVKVDAIRHPVPTNETLISYWVHSGNPLIDERSLRFKEAARHVKTALSGRGLYEADDEDSADLIVEMDYGIQVCPTQFSTTLEPVYARPQPSVVRTPSQSADPNNPTAIRPPPPATDEPVLVGFRNVSIPITNFEKFLTVSVRENIPSAEGRPPPMYFKVQASIEDLGRNLRRCLPVLASAVMDEMGNDTHGPKLVAVPDDDPELAFIRRGLPPPSLAPPTGSSAVAMNSGEDPLRQ